MSSIKLTADSGGGTFEIKAPSSSGNTRVLTLPDTGNLTLGAGKILQVVSTTKTDTFSEDIATGTFSADAMSISITPSNASNKILLLANCSYTIETSNDGGWSFFKDGSLLTGGVADAAGSRVRATSVIPQTTTGQFLTVSGSHLDTAGGTSAITYSVRLHHGSNATRYVYLNKSHTDSNTAYDFRAVSSLTAMEVAA